MWWRQLGSHYSVWRATEPTSTREATRLLLERRLLNLFPNSYGNPSLSPRQRKRRLERLLDAWMKLSENGTKGWLR